MLKRWSLPRRLDGKGLQAGESVCMGLVYSSQPSTLNAKSSAGNNTSNLGLAVRHLRACSCAGRRCSARGGGSLQAGRRLRAGGSCTRPMASRGRRSAPAIPARRAAATCGAPSAACRCARASSTATWTRARVCHSSSRYLPHLLPAQLFLKCIIALFLSTISERFYVRMQVPAEGRQ